MTRKHYIEIAAILKRQRKCKLQFDSTEDFFHADQLIEALADSFKDANPNFNYDKFMEATK